MYFGTKYIECMEKLKHEYDWNVDVLDSKKLTPSTVIKNGNEREKLVKGVLLDLKIIAWYEFFTIQMPGKNKGWEVDFVTNLVYDDGTNKRIVVIEPHDGFDKGGRIEKMSAIRDTYNLYVIIISKREPPDSEMVFYDLCWHMPVNFENDKIAKEEEARLRQELINFMNDKHVEIISEEEAKQILLNIMRSSNEYKAELELQKVVRKN